MSSTELISYGECGIWIKKVILLLALGLLSDEATLERTSERPPEELIQHWRKQARLGWAQDYIDDGLDDHVTTEKIPVVIETLHAGAARLDEMLDSGAILMSLYDVGVTPEEYDDPPFPIVWVKNVLRDIELVILGNIPLLPNGCPPYQQLVEVPNDPRPKYTPHVVTPPVVAPLPPLPPMYVFMREDREERRVKVKTCTQKCCFALSELIYWPSYFLAWVYRRN